MNFLENPQYNGMKIMILVVIIVGSIFFVSKYGGLRLNIFRAGLVENIEGTPIPLGTATKIADTCPQGVGILPGAVCHTIEIMCPDVTTMNAYIRIAEPTGGTNIIGTIVFGSGGAGTSFGYEVEPSSLPELISAGYRLVERAWPSAWNDEGILKGSCRYATLLNYIKTEVAQDQGAMCAYGSSNGAAEVGYAVGRYGASSYMDFVMYDSGPWTADLAQACTEQEIWGGPADWEPERCHALEQQYGTYYPTNNGVCTQSIDSNEAYAGLNWCQNAMNGDQASYDLMKNESLLAPDGQTNFPNTAMSFVYGADDNGQTVPNGLYYADKISTVIKDVTVIPSPAGHGPFNDPNGDLHLYNEMIAKCTERSATVSDDTTPPSTPQSLVVQSTTSDSATLSWKESTDDTGVDHYTVYQVTDDEVGDCDTSYTDVNGTLRYCNEIFTNSQILVTHNIQYSTIDGENLLFDLYTPPLTDDVTDRSLEIFLHGGGGDISDGGSKCNQAARLGYVCISGDYRNDGGHTPGGFFFIDQKYAATDLFALIRFARLHANEYGIDPNRIITGGVSAGSVTALTAALTANDMNNQSWYPSSDNLVNRTNQTYGDGSTVPSWTCMAKGQSGQPSNPTNNLIDGNDPPIALFLGSLDTTYGWSCSTGQALNGLMNGLGIPSYFQCFEGAGHGLNQDTAIEAVTIPMAYRELIGESCPQSYSNNQHID